MFKIKRNATDALFSDYIRERAGWKCERCFKEPEHLECSHFIGRGNKSVRWDPENAACLCYSCHLFFTKNPHEHYEWFKKRLGEESFLALKTRSYWTLKEMRLDEKLIRLGLRMALKKMKNKIIGAR